MKIVLQRVSSAEVLHNGESISKIKNGYVLLVGIKKNESFLTAENPISKILKIKLFENWKKSIVEMGYEILILSQFTLFAEFKGKKPDFHHAEKTNEAKEFYDKFVDSFRKSYIEDKIKIGIFGAELKIELVNDGPVTILFDK